MCSLTIQCLYFLEEAVGAGQCLTGSCIACSVSLIMGRVHWDIKQAGCVNFGEAVGRVVKHSCSLCFPVSSHLFHCDSKLPSYPEIDALNIRNKILDVFHLTDSFSYFRILR